MQVGVGDNVASVKLDPSPNKGRVIAINVADLSPVNDPFTQINSDDIDWISFSGIPRNWLERRVGKFKLSSYRAALEAARSVRPGNIVISHLPGMAAVVATALAAIGKRPPHLAFSFNFTDLPVGLRHSFHCRAFSQVDQFAVYSRFEVDRYAQHFDIDPALVKPVIWTQAVPAVQSGPGIAITGPYVCALGGEGRDFRMLIDAARLLGPAFPMVVIARPHSLLGLSIPDHVTVLTNVPAMRAWRIAADSVGVLIPLKAVDTCCGHITMVSAKMLGLPIATTYSHATREYVEGRKAILQSQPSDAGAFAALIEQLFDQATELRQAARSVVLAECELHSRDRWAAYLKEFLRKAAC